MSALVPSDDFETGYGKIKVILAEARHRAYQAVNFAMVQAYWEIGRAIVEEEQRGKERAEYGKTLVRELSLRLTRDFGKGFDRSNLFHMRAFYQTFPIVDALRRQLSWTHYRTLLKVEKPDARSFYEQEAVSSQWSVRE